MPALAEYTLTRQHRAESMAADLYAVDVAGDIVAMVDWQQARAFMLGKLPPAELVDVGDMATADDAAGLVAVVAV